MTDRLEQSIGHQDGYIVGGKTQIPGRFFRHQPAGNQSEIQKTLFGLMQARI
jgi:hypothetical protein